MTSHISLGQILKSLQQAMHRADFWSEAAITAEALNSQQPFCLDTMNFSQWLQFVFIPRMQVLVDGRLALPRLVKGQGIEPMAGEYFNNKVESQEILLLIRQLDDLLQD